MARRGPRSGARSTRSRRTPVSSTRITRCVRRAAAQSCWRRPRPRHWPPALGPQKATIHRNHGLFTVGHTVDEAAWWFITMERSCQAQLLAEAAGLRSSSTTRALVTRVRLLRLALFGMAVVPAIVGRDLPERSRPLRVAQPTAQRTRKHPGIPQSDDAPNVMFPQAGPLTGTPEPEGYT